jgi:hypothetical protein
VGVQLRFHFPDAIVRHRNGYAHFAFVRCCGRRSLGVGRSGQYSIQHPDYFGNKPFGSLQPSADPTLSRACLARSVTRIRVRMRCCVLNKSNVRAVPLSFAIPADSSSSGSASSPLSSTSTGRCAAPVSVPLVSRHGCPFRYTQSSRCQAAVTSLALNIVCRCTTCHRNCDRMCSCTNDKRSEKT